MIQISLFSFLDLSLLSCEIVVPAPIERIPRTRHCVTNTALVQPSQNGTRNPLRLFENENYLHTARVGTFGNEEADISVTPTQVSTSIADECCRPVVDSFWSSCTSNLLLQYVVRSRFVCALLVGVYRTLAVEPCRSGGLIFQSKSQNQYKRRRISIQQEDHNMLAKCHPYCLLAIIDFNYNSMIC